MWRCFWRQLGLHDSYGVCSTHVEMFLLVCICTMLVLCLLHACGDVSPVVFGQVHSAAVCSTHVEMFLSERWQMHSMDSLLHACGDVSCIDSLCVIWYMSAPRMWRCFIFSSPFFYFTAVQSVCSLSFFLLTHRRIIKGIVDWQNEVAWELFCHRRDTMMYRWIGPGFLGRELLIAE